MKTSIYSFLFIFLCSIPINQVVAQRKDGRAEAGNEVTFRGKIIDKHSMEPIEGRVVYKSLPENDNVGIIDNDEEFKGNFVLTLFDNHNYEMEVKADGYMTFYTHIYMPMTDTMHTYSLVSVKPGEIVRLNTVLFERASSEVNEIAKLEINRLYETMAANKDMVIQLEGHTDFNGDPDLNMKLSQKRIDAVRSYLVDQGISGRRIKTKAFGGTQPLSTAQTKEAIEENMRVEVRILEI